MKVVFLKKNKFIIYNKSSLNGYVFKPRNKNMKSLLIINMEFVSLILSKKIEREILKLKRTINLIVNSNASIIADYDMMLNEVYRITKKFEDKYRLYFDEFEYFEIVKKLYVLYNILKYKKNVTLGGLNEEDYFI